MLADPTQESNLERQVTVRWVPTEAEDFEFQEGIATKAEELRRRLAGQRIQLSQEAFPAEVPESWTASMLDIEFFERSALSGERRSAVAEAFDGARDQDGRTREDLTPFAAVAPEGRPGEPPLYAALASDGGVLITIPGRAGELLWLGDLVTLLCSIELGEALGIESPFEGD
jgi:hypothetical protein